MVLLNSFLGQGFIALMGKIVLFVNTVKVAMQAQLKKKIAFDYISQTLNYLAINIGTNKNMDV